MDEQRACARCGAQNRPDTAYCWQCYAPIGAAAQPVAGAEGGQIAAAIRGGRLGGEGPSGEVPAPVPRGGFDAGAAVRSVALVALVGVCGFLAWRFWFTGFPFPEEVAGHQRIESEQLDQAKDLVRGLTEGFGVEFEMEIYGTAGIPAYGIVVMEVPEGQSPQDLSSSGLAPSPTAPGPPLELTAEGDLALSCGPVPTAVGAFCLWSDQDVLVVMAGYASTSEDLRPVAGGVRSETR